MGELDSEGVICCVSELGTRFKSLRSEVNHIEKIANEARDQANEARKEGVKRKRPDSGFASSSAGKT